MEASIAVAMAMISGLVFIKNRALGMFSPKPFKTYHGKYSGLAEIATRNRMSGNQNRSSNKTDPGAIKSTA
jgi:hypothetical protein